MASATEARAKMEQAIQQRTVNARGVVERVMTQVPQDSIVKAPALRFTYHKPGLPVPALGGEPLIMRAGEEGVWTLHRHALRQVAEKADIPLAYIDTLSAGEPWQRTLLTTILNGTFPHKQEKYLVRAVGTNGGAEARGVLSDKYRRLDSRPILEAFVNAARAQGAVPFDGTATDIRVALKAILPQVYEPIAGEFVAVGIEWSNSDFGSARLSLRSFLLRIVCINGATAEDLLSQVHLGGRLPEDIEFSRRTYELDTRTMTSAVGDVVRSTMSEGGARGLLNRIVVANQKEADWNHLRVRLEKALTKDELQKTEDAFTGPDVLNLPPGATVWRASNALSWVAQTAEDPERRLDLERVAGSLLKNGKKEAA